MMNTNDPVNRMLEKLRAKTLSTAGRRSDIYLADYRLLNNTSACVLLGYASEFGVPTAEDVQAAVARDFEGRLTPALSTAVAHPDHGAIKLIADMVVPTRPYTDADRMVTVASTMFIDQEMGGTWNVVEGADGIKYLQRETEENIDDILKERKQRMMATASVSRLAFGSEITAGVEVSAGDGVRFYAEGSLHSGEVTRVDLHGVHIRTAAGNYTVVSEAVVERVFAGTETAGLDKQRLKEYYTKIYGPEFAEKLVGPHPE